MACPSFLFAARARWFKQQNQRANVHSRFSGLKGELGSKLQKYGDTLMIL
jgi:hypothetical protein